ncbi:MAG: S41 family peptidase [Agriterribacter sp.]
MTLTNMRFKKNAFLLLLLSASAVALFSSCKKELSDNTTTTTDSTATSTNTNSAVNDTAWLYAQDIYLWYKYLPTSFSPANYTDPDAVMEAIRAYSTEPGFSDPVDKWSFAIKQSEWDDVSSGISGDFGLGIFFNAATDLRVSYVEPASPAGAAGITRSWRIISINGNTTISTDDATIDRIATAVYSSTSTDFVFTRPDNTDTAITLVAATYTEQPFLLDTVYTVGSQKVGYMVYNSFLGDVTTVKNQFSTIFSDFSSKGITDLIVDLRYNSGGYVELQNEMANYLVPSAGNSGVMLSEQFNDKYSQYYDTTIYYAKKGSLDLSKIFFITATNTASASELLINSLKPYLDVKLVGRTTYGKPVGYFNIPDGDWYIFPISFRSVNKNGEGNYFDGMTPDATVNDGLTFQWGDTQEECLGSALNYISNGVFSNIASRSASDVLIIGGNKQLGSNRFNGAVTKRKFSRAL